MAKQTTASRMAIGGVLALTVWAAAGCAAPQQSSQPQQRQPARSQQLPLPRGGAEQSQAGTNAGSGGGLTDVVGDPCAAHLHEMSGPLLLFFERNQKLPEQLDELRATPGFGDLALNCPVSGKPYFYDAKGVPTRGPGWRAIIRDAQPHDGRRWGIAIREPVPGQPLVTDVVPLTGK